MYSHKENASLLPQSHFKTPYSRPNNRRTNPAVSKILKNPRTPENSYLRNVTPSKQFILRNSYPNRNVPTFRDYDEPSTSYSSEMASECMNDVYGTSITSFTSIIGSECEPVHFRPRKSHLMNRTLENTLDESLELKMMIDDQENLDNSKKPKLKTAREITSKGFQMKARQNLLRIFTGSVENLLHWSKLKTGLHILFEVTATVDSIQQGKWKTEKKFCLADSESGPKIQVVYYEIDRPVQKLAIHSLVTCTGRLITRNCLQAYKIEESTENQKSDLQRLSFICNRVADELIASQKK